MSWDTESALSLTSRIERWPLTEPFHIAGYSFDHIDVVVAEISGGGRTGIAEAAGVYFLGDTAQDIHSKLLNIARELPQGLSRGGLQGLLPPGGARNVLDCAMWDLEAQLAGKPVWQLAGMTEPQSLRTNFGCGVDTPERMAKLASSYADARAIKLKLTGEPLDADRVAAVRDARPDVWLSVDANQGFTPALLDQVMPTMVDCRVALIEQPFAVGDEALLDHFHSPIPIAADESVRTSEDIPALAGRFDMINIKLDKCGGLTEALNMARVAKAHGLELMVGNMLGTSLAMAPAFVVGQLCSVVDLDGPLFLQGDRAHAARYDHGLLAIPEQLWGSPRDTVQ